MTSATREKHRQDSTRLVPDTHGMFYAGDNLAGLGLMCELGLRADLVYIDPPFASNNEFLIDKDRASTISGSGKTAYSDVILEEDYLSFLKARLMAIRKVMKPTASIYLHIGVSMEHRVRILMDEVFGAGNFRNSITRIKCNPKNFSRKAYGNIKDSVLFYSLSMEDAVWNPQKEPLSDKDIEKLYPFIDDEGNRYTTNPLHAPGKTQNGATGMPWRGIDPPVGRHWRRSPECLEELDRDGRIAWSKTGNPRLIRYASESEGKLPQDVWEYKDPQYPLYPTQKNPKMIERIIRTSSEEGHVVLDCFAGSGETLVQAAHLDRFFVGMDSSPAAKKVFITRMKKYNFVWEELR